MINTNSITSIAMISKDTGLVLFIYFATLKEAKDAKQVIGTSRQTKGIMKWLRQKGVKLETTGLPQISDTDKPITVYRLVVHYPMEGVGVARKAYRYISDRLLPY